MRLNGTDTSDFNQSSNQAINQLTAVKAHQAYRTLNPKGLHDPHLPRNTDMYPVPQTPLTPKMSPLPRGGAPNRQSIKLDRSIWTALLDPLGFYSPQMRVDRG